MGRTPRYPLAMPRQARLDAPGTLHHVMGRGLADLRLFQAKGDAEDFLARVARLAKAGDVQVYAWALMPTHFPLLLRTGAQPLPTSMRQLLTGFAVTCNRRHKRHGYLFQNRYKSIGCEDEPFLLDLTR